MSEELFDRAVVLIRKGTPYPELISELEAASRTPMDVRDVIAEVSKYVETFQAECLEAAVSAAKSGMSQFENAKRLRSLGFQSWDADVIAARAEAKAKSEVAAETNGNTR